MDKDEFLLHYYFNMYKDTSVIGHAKFRKEFKEKHNVEIDLDELIYLIEFYQIKKYGELKRRDEHINYYDANKLKIDSNQRMYSRFGNKEERDRRKQEYESAHKRR